MQELSACTTVQQLFALWHRVYDYEKGPAKCDASEWHTAQFYRFRIEAQIKHLETKGMFLAEVTVAEKTTD